MKIALVGSRVGYIHRGFESFTRSLFGLLEHDIDITLLKGGGRSSDREVVIPSLWLQGGALSALGLGWQRRMQVNEQSFAVGMLPHLLRTRYDVIHFSEYGIGRLLLKWRALFGLTYKLLFSNGAPAPPELYGCFDLTQEVTPVRMQEAIAHGLPATRLAVVPYGIDCDRFSKAGPEQKLALRQRYDIPADAFVVLCVAALKKHHKRLHVLIDAMQRVHPSNCILVAAGQPTEETELLRQQAEAAIPGRYRFLTLPHETMHDVYRFSDLFVLPSLEEGFGIVIIEAMAAGLPVLVNDAPTFRWIVANDECHVDMADESALAARISAHAASPAAGVGLGSHLSDSVRSRFDWRNLKADYVSLYRRAIDTPALSH